MNLMSAGLGVLNPRRRCGTSGQFMGELAKKGLWGA